jgi:predicted nucleotidyltransferase
VSTPDAAPNLQRLPRVQTYLDHIVRSCAQIEQPLVSMILFGSAASGGFSNVSDVDLIIVVPNETTADARSRLRAEVARLEIVHGFRPPRPVGALRARVERAVGHLFSCFICTRDDLLSGDVARILGLRPWEAPFVDRIVLASIVATAVTAWGEDLLPQVVAPAVRRLDVFKALFGFSCQIVLIVQTFPMLPDATKYAMGTLKHSLHNCFFCYHRRTEDLEKEVEFFDRRLGGSRALGELMLLRRQYQRSFGFVIRCLPTIARIHFQTARDNDFAGTDFRSAPAGTSHRRNSRD